MKKLSQKLFLAAFMAVMLFFAGRTTAHAQTTTWVFEAGDNSGGKVRLIEYPDGRVTVGLFNAQANNFTLATLEKIDYVSSDYTYMRVKSTGTGRMYEIDVDWYNDKLTQRTPEGGEIVYWLKQ